MASTVALATLAPAPAGSAAAPPPDTASEFFAAAGITVSAIDAPVVGDGVSFTDWQADNLYRQARAGQGWTGAQWRAHVPLPDDVIPIDYIVGGWLVGEQTPAATAARQLADSSVLADPANPGDPADFVFSQAVMALFVHDIVTRPDDAGGSFSPDDVAPTAAASAPTADPSGLHGHPRHIADACSGLLAFYDGALQQVFDTVGGKDSVIGVIAQQAIGWLPIPKPPFSIPKKNDMGGFQMLGMLIGLAGAITPWSVTIEVTPDPVAYGIVPAPGNEATARLIVDPGLSVEWPPALKSCAGLAGIDLPDLSPVGATVTWSAVDQGLGPHATMTDHWEVVMSDGEQFWSSLTFRTATETPEQATGPATYGAIAIVAQVQRPGDQTFKGVLDVFLGRYLGPDSIIGAALGALVGPLVESLDEMNSPPPAFAFPTVTFHIDPPPPTATAPPEATPAPDEPWRACAGRLFTSVGGDGMPAGVALTIADDGRSVFFEFGASESYSETRDGITVTVKLAGTMTGSGSPAGDTINSQLVANNLAGTIDVMGNTITMDSTMLPQFGSERIVCNPDGSVTVTHPGATSGYLYR